MPAVPCTTPAASTRLRCRTTWASGGPWADAGNDSRDRVAPPGGAAGETIGARAIAALGPDGEIVPIGPRWRVLRRASEATIGDRFTVLGAAIGDDGRVAIHNETTVYRWSSGSVSTWQCNGRPRMLIYGGAHLLVLREDGTEPLLAL